MTASTQVLTEQDVFLTRVIDAPRDLVWAAFTQPEHLAQWWGPAGCPTRVIAFDLRVGGLFHYGFRYAERAGETCGKFVYREIEPPERIVFVLSFADGEGNVVRAPFSPTWPLEMLCQTLFDEQGSQTRLTMSNKALDASDEEMATYHAGREGMAEGTNSSLDQLSKYLQSLRA